MENLITLKLEKAKLKGGNQRDSQQIRFEKS